MPKARIKKAVDKQKITDVEPKQKRQPLYAILPWACQHYTDNSELKAYVPASGVWEIVAKINRTAGASAETMAEYIMSTVNEYEKLKNTLDDAITALELCLQCDGLTWEAEREAEITVRRARERT